MKLYIKNKNSETNKNSSKTKHVLLSGFYIWIHYNWNGRIKLYDVDDAINEFLEATSGKNKYCSCKTARPKAVNHIWHDWHCTYCLKPIYIKNRI